MESFVGDLKPKSEQKLLLYCDACIMIDPSYITLSEDSEPDRFPSFNCRYLFDCCTFCHPSSSFCLFSLFKGFVDVKLNFK